MDVLKKGQVAIFLILALGIIIVVGLLLFARNSNQPVNTNQLDFPPAIEPVVVFVEGCLFDSTVKGLRLLGRQGGVIWESQNGTVPDSLKDRLTLNNSNIFVWYSILPGKITYGLSCAPEHFGGEYNYERCPSITFPFVGENSDDLRFGEFDTTPRAHDVYGGFQSNRRMFNQVYLPGLYERENETQTVEWTRSLLNARMKIRPNLAHFIEINISECLNFSELLRDGLNVTPVGLPVVNPIFSEETTKVMLDYPLKVVQMQTGQTTYVEKFSIETQVRFGKIYKYVNDILTKEAKDYNFNLSSASPETGTSLEFLERDVEKKVDLVIFNDTESWLPDESGAFVNYKFYGSIPDSPPAMSYIHFWNVSAVPSLLGTLSHCDDAFSVPFVNDRLSVWAFKHITRDSVECIYNAYDTFTGMGTYKRAYDPDDDELNWTFKASDCNWDESCFLDNNAEFENMLTWLEIRYYEIDEPTYDDRLLLPLVIYNYGPGKATLDCVQEKPGWYVYKFGIQNPESGSGQDPISISVDFIGASLDYRLPDAPDDSTPGWVYFKVWFENKTGTYDVKFTATDSFGAENSTIQQVTIPC